MFWRLWRNKIANILKFQWSSAGSDIAWNAALQQPIDTTINIMKTLKLTIGWTIVIFIILTLVTMKNDGESDGITAFGFPLTFYKSFSGKCDNCYDQYGFKILSLLTDIVLIVVLVFIATELKKKFSRQK